MSYKYYSRLEKNHKIYCLKNTRIHQILIFTMVCALKCAFPDLSGLKKHLQKSNWKHATNLTKHQLFILRFLFVCYFFEKEKNDWRHSLIRFYISPIVLAKSQPHKYVYYKMNEDDIWIIWIADNFFGIISFFSFLKE